MRNTKVGFCAGFAAAVLMGFAAVTLLGTEPTQALEPVSSCESGICETAAK